MRITWLIYKIYFSTYFLQKTIQIITIYRKNRHEKNAIHSLIHAIITLFYDNLYNTLYQWNNQLYEFWLNAQTSLKIYLLLHELASIAQTDFIHAFHTQLKRILSFLRTRLKKNVHVILCVYVNMRVCTNISPYPHSVFASRSHTLCLLSLPLCPSRSRLIYYMLSVSEYSSCKRCYTTIFANNKPKNSPDQVIIIYYILTKRLYTTRKCVCPSPCIVDLIMIYLYIHQIIYPLPCVWLAHLHRHNQVFKGKPPRRPLSSHTHTHLQQQNASNRTTYFTRSTFCINSRIDYGLHNSYVINAKTTFCSIFHNQRNGFDRCFPFPRRLFALVSKSIRVKRWIKRNHARFKN